MNSFTDSLPNDIDKLREIVRERDVTIAALEAERNKVKEQLEHLVESLRLANKKLFGKCSEKDPNQIELDLFDVNQIPPADDEADSVEVGPHKRKRKKYRDLPDELPRIIVNHDLSDAEKLCNCGCGREMNYIGVEKSEQLAVVPHQFFVIVHVRHKYASHHADCIRTAPMPPMPIPSSQASAQLLGHCIVSKFHDGLPLYRQEKMAARQGVDLPRGKLARWLVQLAPMLQPLFNLLLDAFFNFDISYIDATGVQVLKEQGRRPESKSYLWIRRGGPPDRPVVLVDYEPSKNSPTVYQLLEQTKGYLVCDAANEFNLSIKLNGLSAVYCNDHARRKFRKVIEGVNDKTKIKDWAATKAVNYYKRLYRLEREIAGLTPHEKYIERQKVAVPIWNEFLEWAEAEYSAGVAHRRSREALGYLLGHTAGLRRYCDDGRLPISNIRTEHVAKTIAVARKNFLFADTVEGAQASAIYYSLLESAKSNQHNALHYITVIIDRMPHAETIEDIEDLLPWNLSPERASELYHQLPRP